MTRLQIDHMYIFDVDSLVKALEGDRFEASVLADMPEWMEYPEVIAAAAREVEGIDKFVGSLCYQFGDNSV